MKPPRSTGCPAIAGFFWLRCGPAPCATQIVWHILWTIFHRHGSFSMNDSTREKLLKTALIAFGAIFFLIYPLGLVWPSGWQWHGGEGKYYLQMICGVYAVLGAFLIAAAREPSEHRSLISFTIWSSFVHAGIMAAQSISDHH